MIGRDLETQFEILARIMPIIHCKLHLHAVPVTHLWIEDE